MSAKDKETQDEIIRQVFFFFFECMHNLPWLSYQKQRLGSKMHDTQEKKRIPSNILSSVWFQTHTFMSTTKHTLA